MKMTDADERALDVLDRLVQDLGSITEEDAIGLSNYLRARLAADQQKGGGEVVSHEMLDKAEADLNAKDEFGNLYVSEETYRYATALIGWMRDRTPQPSIPAPAQLDFQTQVALIVGANEEDQSDILSHVQAYVTAQQDGKASGGEVDDGR